MVPLSNRNRILGGDRQGSIRGTRQLNCIVLCLLNHWTMAPAPQYMPTYNCAIFPYRLCSVTAACLCYGVWIMWSFPFSSPSTQYLKNHANLVSFLWKQSKKKSKVCYAPETDWQLEFTTLAKRGKKDKERDVQCYRVSDSSCVDHISYLWNEAT
jgi:hypothetical protein